MPRHARLDSPGTLHHVIVRGLERGAMPHGWIYESLLDDLPWPDSP